MKPTLQPLEDFVLKRKLDLGIGGLTYENLALEVIKLAEFLKSTPLLKHFIECDENGEPMVVYHGSEDKFNIFKKERRDPLQCILILFVRIPFYNQRIMLCGQAH